MSLLSDLKQRLLDSRANRRILHLLMANHKSNARFYQEFERRLLAELPEMLLPPKELIGCRNVG
jgi:hypothetical protein